MTSGELFMAKNGSSACAESAASYVFDSFLR
jgi:hypothetical protein